MLTKLWEFRKKSLQYEQQARKASDDLARASYIGLTEAYRELAKMLEQDHAKSVPTKSLH
jgi:hypothetical protein